MKRTSYDSLLLTSVLGLLGLTVVFLSGCGNETHVALAQNGKIVLYPGYGDKIIWSQDPTNGVQVHFLLPAFCKETDLWLTQCTVNVQLKPNDFGKYNYICKGQKCIDPEVDVGSSTGNPLGAGKSTAVRDADPDVQVGLPCEGGTIKPSPADVPGDFYGPITSGKIVQWLSQGIAPLKDWTVTFDAGNDVVCELADIHSVGGVGSCKIKTGLPGRAYKYTAKSPTCMSGSGTVTVQ